MKTRHHIRYTFEISATVAGSKTVRRCRIGIPTCNKRKFAERSALMQAARLPCMHGCNLNNAQVVLLGRMSERRWREQQDAGMRSAKSIWFEKMPR